MIHLIAAIASNGVIGREGRLPWHLPADLRRFKELTTGNIVIMGRKTFESIGAPLKDRSILVLSRHAWLAYPGVVVAAKLRTAIDFSLPSSKEIFIAGGAEVYREALPIVNRMYLTRIHASFEGDTYFPEWDPKLFTLVEAEHRVGFSFQTWERVRGDK